MHASLSGAEWFRSSACMLFSLLSQSYFGDDIAHGFGFWYGDQVKDFEDGIMETTRFTLCSPNHPDATGLVEQFYRELGVRLNQGFDRANAILPDERDMTPPRGGFWVAYSQGTPIGCVGLKATDRGFHEIKRLWVSPEGRGQSLGKKLMQLAEENARALGVKRLALDTNHVLQEATGLYFKLGWKEIERYNDEPHADMFFEKTILA